MKKILALTLPLMFLTLITIPAGNAVITPVEVERVNEVWYFIMRGDHHSASFLFHYVNLAPETQGGTLSGTVKDSEGVEQYTVCLEFILGPGDTIDEAWPGGYGWTFSFYIEVWYPQPCSTLITEVIIPPPSLELK